MFSVSPSKSSSFTNQIPTSSSPLKNSNSLEQRLAFQLKNIQNLKNNDTSFFLYQQSEPLVFNGWIRGPENSPYKGGKFNLSIRLPKQYPFQPPKVKFTTKIFHPNVSRNTGLVKFKMFQNSWSPTLTLTKILQQLIKLLQKPETKQIYETEMLHFYTNNFDKFYQTAKEWTQNYAK